MSYFQHLTPLVSGTTVRAAPLNVIFDGIQAGFEFLPEVELSEKGFASTLFVQDAVTDDHAVNLRTLRNLPTFSIPQMDFGANLIKNILDPVDDQDAATKIWVINQTAGIVSAATQAQLAAEAARDAAQGSEASVAADAATATAQAGIASTSASNALVSETNSGISASNASTSETNASNSETNANNSAIATAADALATASDASATAADRIVTTQNATDTAADVIQTAADRVQTTADAASSNASASNASTSETNALASENKAADWAEELEDVEVEPGKFSALHWAAKAQSASIGDINLADVIGLVAALDSKAELAGAAFTGAITTTSTIDGRNVATDGSKLDGIASNANNYTHPSFSPTSINTSGAEIIDALTFGADGHVSAVSTRTLTAGILGAVGVSAKAADSELLDGIDSGSFLRSDTADTVEGQLTFNASALFDRGTQALPGITFDGDTNTGIYQASVNANHLRFAAAGFERFEVNTSGVNVTGNLTISGNVDGRNIGSDGSKLDSIALGANNYVHSLNSTTNINTSGATIVDQISTDSEGHVTVLATRVMTVADIGAQASGTYNTVIGTDSDFLGAGATVLSSLTLNDGVVTNFATRTLTPSNIGALAENGVATDSQRLDGIDSSNFLRSDISDTITGGTLTLNDNVILGFGTSQGEAEIYSNGTELRFDMKNNKDIVIRDAGISKFLLDSSTGDFHADGEVYSYSVSVGSDPKLKRNLNPINNALDKIEALNGYTFDWIKTGKSDAGLMSTDIKQVLPEAVKERKIISSKVGETFESVNYNAVTGLIVEAIKELKYNLENLRADEGLV